MKGIGRQVGIAGNYADIRQELKQIESLAIAEGKRQGIDEAVKVLEELRKDFIGGISWSTIDEAITRIKEVTNGQ